ncbi:MAG: 16S rRNA (cytosine(1402)-N(4))-methyltransferase RsmH [Chloroflexi bacterium]|nr:16S rRNA (cytosine(1402)-N(4))-methyltransferase RsmH [Chloroflexota bacterium]
MAYHTPVMLEAVLEALRPRSGGWYVDCTLGEGHHAKAILEASAPDGRLLGLDADPEAVRAAQFLLRDYSDRAVLVHTNFAQLAEVAAQCNVNNVDGVFFDLGLSSRQLEAGARGFSFKREETLDMRFDPRGTITAEQIVNEWSEQELAQVIQTYGEEPRARRIARAIVRSRPVHTSGELARAVAAALGGARGRIHPATRTFQALRIAVNRELENLEAALNQAIPLLGQGGRLVVLSYHSLEDRVVKGVLRRAAARCICPPGTAVCTCGHRPELRWITRHVVTPSLEEVRRNPRSRSARMRVAERL